MNHIISFLISIIFIVLLFASSSCSLIGKSSRSISEKHTEVRPNIILIMTDDQPPHTMEYMPNLNQELIEKGVNFTQGYVTTPLCSPSRASILTGQYTHNHGVKSNRPPRGSALAFDDIDTISVWMQDAGYVTSHIGKYINGYDLLEPQGYIPPGWDDWNVFFHKDEKRQYYYNYSLAENGEIVPYGKTEDDYGTDVLTNKAVEFIEGAQDRPFFLVVSYYAPHQTYQFAKRHKDLFRSEDQVEPHRPPNFAQADLSGKPEWLQELKPVNSEYVDNVHQRVLRTLMAVDDGIGEIVDALERIDQRDNTMIVYISDNGLAMGEHKMTIGKNCPYEQCISIPYVISYPNVIDSPHEDDRFVLNVDLAPTFVELAKLELRTAVDGESLIPLLANPSNSWREEFFFEHFRAENEEGMVAHIPSYTGMRTANWKYIQFETGEKELYDMIVDPYEMSNLAYDPKYEAEISHFMEGIEEYQQGVE